MFAMDQLKYECWLEQETKLKKKWELYKQCCLFRIQKVELRAVSYSSKRNMTCMTAQANSTFTQGADTGGLTEVDIYLDSKVRLFKIKSKYLNEWVNKWIYLKNQIKPDSV